MSESREKRVSSGVIVFRNNRDKIEYLLLKSRTGDWEFPKGSIEDNEELQQTALRELEEETGISDVRLLDGFRDDYSYIFQDGRTEVDKTVHLFIGKSHETKASLSKEHHDHQWRDLEQAVGTVTHDGPRRILERAHEFIQEQEE